MSDTFITFLLYARFLKNFRDMPLSLHNPFVQDVEDAPLSTFDTFHTVVKSVYGIGTLCMPIAFACTGYVGGILLTIFLSCLYIYGIHLTVKCMAEVSDRVSGEVTMGKAYAYVSKSRILGHFVNVLLILLHTSIAVLYIYFISENLKSVSSFIWETEVDTRIIVAVVTICIIPVFLIRDVQYLVPLNIAGNVLTLLIIGYVIVDTIEMIIFGIRKFKMAGSVIKYDVDLFVGCSVLSFSSVGVMVKIASKMAEPEKYLGWWGTLNRAACFVLCTNVIWGVISYGILGDTQYFPFLENYSFSYGLEYKLVAAALVYLTYPLNGYVVVDTIFNEYINKTGDLNHPLRIEFIVRIIFLLISGCCALALSFALPIIKYICGLAFTLLNVAFPAYMQLTLGYNEYDRKWLWRVLHISIVVLGILVAYCIGRSAYYDSKIYYTDKEPFWIKPNVEIN
ncbi:glutamate transporter polyphemus-like isoform X1 [Drosophila nasuta]|uniref:glutamate transporter polyphemus-like isoform X1 n=1 Tax=Drosophila nasuta TaxID=42062 RepID=UPI00295E7A09|nr:glutamate transporter polyphemus-like isoform X1 [Drosophila nasuta]